MKTVNYLGLVGLHHVSLRVADLDRSLGLYRDTLGLLVKVSFTLDGRRFAILEAGNSGYIELVETKAAPIHAGRDDDAIWHFALRTNDLDRSLAAVERSGYQITLQIRPLDLIDTTTGTPLSIRVAFFRGPDGEDVELFEDKRGHT